MDRIDSLSLNLEKNNIDKIKQLFPEAVEEGKINFEMLRAMLGDDVDDSKEKYTKIKGLSVHYCAAYVINRRGMGFVD